MHAVVVRVNIPEGAVADARSMLESQVVPAVKANAGFVAGYWLAPEDGEGMSVIVFDSEQHAQAAAKNVQPPPQVQVIKITLREVVASG